MITLQLRPSRDARSIRVNFFLYRFVLGTERWMKVGMRKVGGWRVGEGDGGGRRGEDVRKEEEEEEKKKGAASSAIDFRLKMARWTPSKHKCHI